MSRAGRAILLAAAALVVTAVVASAPRGPETPEQRVERISSELRCPVCQGLSVRDSPSETSRAMREVIAQRVAEGRSDDEIRDEFRRSYGDWILLAPPALAPAGVMWLLPLAVLAAGALAALRLVRTSARPEGPPPAPEELALLRARLAESEEP